MAKGRDAAQNPKKGAGAEPRPKRGAQVAAAFRVARKNDPRLPWLLLAIFVVVLAAMVGLGFLLHHPVIFAVFGVFAAALVTLIVFARRAERAAYASVEGQVGAAAGVLQNMRGRWTVTPAVAVTRAQDVVHRVVGRCGVVLVGEGVPSRLGTLFAQERKKLQRVSPDTPVTEFVIGNDAGQLPLRALQRKLLRLPRTVPAAQVAEVDRRLKAMGGLNVPIPKGPLPRNVRMPKGPGQR